jgi:hypothetical protein
MALRCHIRTEMAVAYIVVTKEVPMLQAVLLMQ